MKVAEGVGRAAEGAEMRIGAWTLDARHNELRRDGETVHLEPKATAVLGLLARNPGMAVAREELLDTIWPGVVVGDDALTQAIIKLRKALGDDAHSPKYIETISKRGYRLIASVSVVSPAATSPDPDLTQTRPRRRRTALVAGAAAAALALGAFIALPKLPWPLGSATGHSAVQAAVPTVAVMPFANLSGDPRRDYFSDGITEDMIHALGRFSGVRVMSRRAVEPYKGKSASPATIRAELGARYIVQGSMRESGGNVRVAVELSDAQTGALLASETYDAQGAELFEIQDRIVRAIVGKLHVKLTQLELERAFARPTQSLEAYDLVLRARALIHRGDRSANREARALLARAQELAPDYAEIRNALGVAEFQRATDGWVEDAVAATRRAEELAKQVLSSPDSRMHARAHSLLASIYSHQERYEDALSHAQAALDLNPSEMTAVLWRGSALMCVGRIDEAIALLEDARRLEPSSAGQGMNLAIAYFVSGRYADALRQADAILVRSPRHVYAHAMRAAALATLGKPEDAHLAAGEVRRIDPLFDPDNYGTRFQDKSYSAMLREGLRKAGL